MQFTSGLSFVLYNNKFSLAAQCTGGLGTPAACQGGSYIKCLDLYSDIYSLEQIRIIHSKPHYVCWHERTICLSDSNWCYRRDRLRFSAAGWWPVATSKLCVRILAAA